MALTKDGKRVVLKVQEVKMADLKKGDKFFVVEDGVLMNEGRILVADADGTTNNSGVGAIEAHII